MFGIINSGNDVACLELNEQQSVEIMFVGMQRDMLMTRFTNSEHLNKVPL